MLRILRANNLPIKLLNQALGLEYEAAGGEPRMQPGRALVTGATGCIGREIVRILLNQGHLVNVLVRDTRKLREVLGAYSEHNRLRVTEGDLSNIESLKNAAVGIDSVFHAAAKVHSIARTRTEEDDFFRVNTEGTKNLIHCIREQTLRRFVFLSTVAVYGKKQRGAVTEDDRSQPDTAYARSKHEAESMVKHALPRQGVRPVILRLPLVYGPGERGNFLRMVKAIDQRRFILIDGGKSRKSIVFSSDAAAAAIEAAFLETVAGETFLIADPKPYEIRQLAETISQELGKRLFPISLSSRFAAATLDIVGRSVWGLRADLKYRSSDIMTLASDRICDVSKMKSVLGFLPAVGLKIGIKRTIEWYKYSAKSQDAQPL